MNIGIDILYIPRLKRMIESNSSFIKKVYTKTELEIAEKMENSLFFLATRFAAKEAIIKATSGKYDFKEIEITKADSGKPIPKIISNENIEIDLSLSYDQDYTIAFCIVKNSQN